MGLSRTNAKNTLSNTGGKPGKTNAEFMDGSAPVVGDGEVVIEVDADGADSEDGLDDDGVVDAFGFAKGEAEALAIELIGYIDDMEQDQRELRESWMEWRRQMDAEPRQKEKNWPMTNSSNVSPPLSQIHGQGISSELINYFDVDPFFGVNALQDADLARMDAACLTRYLTILANSPSDLGMAKIKREVCTEVGIMGRSVMKVPYTRVSWKFKKNLGDDTVQTMTWHEGPEVVSIQQEDIYFPKEWSNVHEMPWIAQVLHMPEHQLQGLSADGTYENVDVVLGSPRDTSTVAERARDKTAGMGGSERKGIYDIVEVYFYHDADKDGYVEDHIWTIDRESKTILRREYNSLGRRPFAFGFYIKRPGEMTGRGTGKLCATLQDEVEGIHNARNDNIKLANTRMIRMRRSVAETNGEAIYPGKIWFADSMDDIGTLQLGEVYPSSLQAENLTWQLAAQATGLSEVQRGFSDPKLGSRDTFRGQAMRSQNAKGIFSTVADELAETWNEVGMLILYQLVAHSDEVLAREKALGRLTQADQDTLARVLTADVTELPSKFAFTVATAQPEKTQAGQMQMIGQVAQWFQTWAQETSPLAMQLFSPQGLQMQQQAPELWKHMMTIYTGSTKLMSRMMKTAGFDDPGSFVPDVNKWDMLLKMMDQMDQARIGGLRDVTGTGTGSADQGLGSQGGAGTAGTEGEMGGGLGGGQGSMGTPQGTAGRSNGGGGGGTGGGGGGVQALPSAGMQGSLA